MARVFVAIDDLRGIVGFYSLSSFTLAIADLPPEHASRLPRYDAIPAALTGRLARDEKVRGEGVGDLLLADAVRRVIGASRSLAVFAIVVEATDENNRPIIDLNLRDLQPGILQRRIRRHSHTTDQ